MKHSEYSGEIEQLWERALVRATEETRRSHELAPQKLNDAAGLRLRSGLKASGWSSSSNNCSALDSCDNC